MKTDIEYLTLIEKDLEKVAAREAEPPRNRASRVGRSLRWIPAAALIVLIAFTIGSFLQADQPDKFNAVGSAVSGADEGGDSFGYVDEPAPGPSAIPRAANGEEPADDGGNDLSKIVRDGKIDVEIADGDLRDALEQVVAIADDAGGIVLSTSTEGGDAGTLTLRIPSAAFDRAFLAVGRLGTVTSSSTKGEDVTAEYIDLRARLKIQRAKRDFYLGLFQDATTVEQSIAMGNRLEDAQLELEQLQGQMRYLQDQVALSTLRVSLREADAPEAETESPVDRPSLGRAISLAWQGTLRVLATVVIGLGYLLPLAIVAGLVALVVTRVRRRGRGAS